MTFKCMTCGNNVVVEQNEIPKCNICTDVSMLVLITEENKDKLPFPTNPIKLTDPSENCQCSSGRCPCGKFVAHKIDEPCNATKFLDK